MFFTSNVKEDIVFLEDEIVKTKSLGTQELKQNISLFKIKSNGIFVIYNILKINENPYHIS
ncbi:MAG: hypothetical protein LBL77_00800 [Endomicrobium sp.]|jgi:hypothetical protein|nr:hypothetical protein [Endomicrobium sp.]